MPRRQERVKAARLRVNRLFARRACGSGRDEAGARSADRQAIPDVEGSVADLAYALLIIVGFALLALTLKGLERL